MRRVFGEQRQTAGCGRVAAILNGEGTPCSVGLVADHMRTSLVTDALEMARLHGHVRTGAVLHRPLEPAQYCLDEFVRYCTRTGVRRSLGRTGVCWDNAAESFFATLKNEMYHRYS